MFMTYCFEKAYSPTSIASYISGLSFFHKINGWYSIADVFVVRKLLQGCRRLRPVVDKRAPITVSMLRQICTIMPTITYTYYETVLFKALFTVAFFGLFRVGELVDTTSGNAPIMVDSTQINLAKTHVSLVLKVTKNNQYGHPMCIKLPCESEKLICPVNNLGIFLAMRPRSNGNLFIHENMQSVTRCQFSSVLNKVLSQLGFNCKVYKTHSFRIGRATQLASMGFPDEVIMRLGRWKSDAFMSYIR